MQTAELLPQPTDRVAVPILPAAHLPVGRAVPVPARPRWERIATAIIILLSVAVQLNAVVQDGAEGQDFPNNYGECVYISQHFSEAWPIARTNPPGFHLLAAVIIRGVGIAPSVVAIGLVNLGFSVGALLVLQSLIRRLIGQPIFRVGAMLLIAFVPARLIHGVVVSSDALTLLPFFGLGVLLSRLTEQGHDRQRWWTAVWIGLVLTAGMLIKYTYMSSAIAVGLVLVQMWRRRQIGASELRSLFALTLALPVMVLLLSMSTQISVRENFGMNGEPADNMTYASVFGVRAADPHVLSAPRYDEPNLEPSEIPIFESKDNDHDTHYELMIPNRYSYLALLHWATFTDPLNIFQHRTAYTDFGERDAYHQSLMTIAVRSAVPITLGCLVAGILVSVSIGWRGLLTPIASRADLEAVWLLGIGWFANIALCMPHVHGAYLGGYWTPRLVLPGLLTFMLLTFHVLDGSVRGRATRIVGAILLIYLAWQAAIQAAFLWL